MNSVDTCGCCEGAEILTPIPTANRPGLAALSYRAGTHATFLQTMLARLSSSEFPELAALKTRDPGDPAIALLDSWATVADVLTFYQERLANEGYLRTATERRSILELARLIGYRLRPGVASTAYLAYTIDEDRSTIPPTGVKTTIPASSRAQSVPDAGELPQTFETAEALEARSAWNDLQVRFTQPQTEGSIKNANESDPAKPSARIYLKGISTNLKPNDPLLIQFENTDPKVKFREVRELFRVIEVKPDAAENRTWVSLQEWKSPETIDSLESALKELVKRYLDPKQLPQVGDVQAVKEASNTLNDLKDKLGTWGEMTPVAEVVAYLEGVVVPKVSAAFDAIAKSGENEAALPWLQRIILDLNGLILRVSTPTAGSNITDSPTADQVIRFDQLIEPLLKPASLQPANSARLNRTLTQSLAEKSDTGLRLLTSFQPTLKDTLTNAMAKAKVTPSNPIRVYALRLKAALYGNNALREPQFEPLLDPATGRSNGNGGQLKPQSTWPEWTPARDENDHLLFLDSDYNQLLPGGFVALLKPDSTEPVIYGDIGVRSLSRSAYGLSAKTTIIALPADSDPWWAPDVTQPETFSFIRRTTVYAQSEELLLAEEPILDPVCGGQTTPIDLAGIYSGLEPGRWLIVSGERTDVNNDQTEAVPGVKGSDQSVVVPGVMGGELVMLAGSEQGFDKDSPGDTNRTTIRLAADLAYCYRRDTVVIYGNVVKATHGETRKEVLGAGDGSQALQQFTLKQPPLTYIPSATPAGAASTLVVRVNDVAWQEVDSLADLAPSARNFTTSTDDDGRTTVIFGNGQEGSRLPTGQENIRAVYRNGIGKPGNVKPKQISLLMSRPLGVKDVINPLRASGGADKESRDQARRNAPLAVMALDRLVSTRDYADFARTFAGIGKASAARLADGRRQLVHVTIAGADDIPIDQNSDVFRNLREALLQLGDPFLPIRLATRQLKLLVIQANVRVLAGYMWENVKPDVESALLAFYSFDQCGLGEDLQRSEAIGVIQKVKGVDYVDLDNFDALDEDQVRAALAANEPLAKLIKSRDQIIVEPAQLNPDESDPGKRITPAALAYLSPDVPSTILLNEIP